MKKLLLAFSLLALTVSGLQAQICGTPTPANPTIYSDQANARTAGSTYCVDIFFHIVRNSNGTYAFTPPNLDAIINYLNPFFSVHGITFRKAGSAFIDNTAFVSIGADPEPARLGQTDNRFRCD